MKIMSDVLYTSNKTLMHLTDFENKSQSSPI